MKSPSYSRKLLMYNSKWTSNLYVVSFVFFSLISKNIGLFTPGKQYIYKYTATASSGVLVPSKAQSSWGFSGSLVVQVNEDAVFMQFQSLKTKMSNGIEEMTLENNTSVLEDSAEDLLKPFKVQYKNGLIENFSVESNEATWASNIKRSVAGILQLDLAALKSEVAFHSVEINHYGRCTLEYVVTIESENKRVIRKSVDPRTCVGHPHQTWSNVPRMSCANNNQNPVLKSSERFYDIYFTNHEINLNEVNATGEIYVQPFQSFGEAHFVITRSSSSRD